MTGAWSALIISAAVVVLGSSATLAQAPTPAQPPATAPAPTRIAFVDVSRVLARSAAGVAAREQLERDKASMQKEMDAKRVEIEKMREDLDKKGTLMTAEARRDREDQLERKRRDATRLADDYQRELMRKEQALAQKVLQELGGVIERLGKQRGYYLILERRGAGILYGTPDADLTDEIIRAYDQEAATKGKK
jgi:outer membrane protein